MRFWNVDALKGELVEKQLTRRMTLKYFFAFCAFMWVGTSVSPGIYYGSGPWTMFCQVLQAVAWVVAVLACYVRNGGTSGNRTFLSRLWPLGFVVGVRFLAVMVPTAVLVTIIVVWAGQEHGPLLPLFDSLCTLVYSWRLVAHFFSLLAALQPLP